MSVRRGSTVFMAINPLSILGCVEGYKRKPAALAHNSFLLPKIADVAQSMVPEAEEHVTTWGGQNKMRNLGLWISYWNSM